MVSLTCSICQKEFDRPRTYGGAHSYCSKKCRDISIRRAVDARNALVRNMIACDNCGREFTRAIPKKKNFCSQRCHDIARSIREKEHTASMHIPKNNEFVEGYRYIKAPIGGCVDCVFVPHCSKRVKLGAPLLCEKFTQRDIIAIENSPYRTEIELLLTEARAL